MAERRFYVRDDHGRFADSPGHKFHYRDTRSTHNLVHDPNAEKKRKARISSFEAMVRRDNAAKKAAGGIVPYAAKVVAAKRAGASAHAVKGKKIKR